MGDAGSVRVEQHDGWASVVLNRPHRRNAITGPMADGLADTIESLGADSSIAAIVLRGEGGAFCSGVDLTELQAQPPPPWAASFGDSTRRVHLALFRCPCPVIGAIERYGINAGAALAFATDILVTGATSFVQIGEIRQGVGMPMNAAWLRLKTTEAVIARLALYGDRVPASELLRLGIAHEVVDDDSVVERAEEIAATMAGFPPVASRTTKADLRRHLDIDPDTWFVGSGGGDLMTAPLLRDS